MALAGRFVERASDPRRWYVLPLLVGLSMLAEDGVATSGVSNTTAFVTMLPLNVIIVAWATVRLSHSTLLTRATVAAVIAGLLLWPSGTSLHHEMSDLSFVVVISPLLLAVVVMLVISGIDAVRHVNDSTSTIEEYQRTHHTSEG
jgi:hypothetical protein